VNKCGRWLRVKWSSDTPELTQPVKGCCGHVGHMMLQTQVRRNCHSTPIRTPTPHHKIFTCRMLFLTPNQQCRSIEGKHGLHEREEKSNHWLWTDQRLSTYLVITVNARHWICIHDVLSTVCRWRRTLCTVWIMLTSPVVTWKHSSASWRLATKICLLITQLLLQMLCITYLLSRHMATENIRMPTRTEIHMHKHNMRKTLGEEWTCAFGDMLTDKQTDMLITTVCSHISICCRVWIFSQFHRIMLLLTCKSCSFLHTVYCAILLQNWVRIFSVCFSVMTVLSGWQICF